jgi:isoquinoline 1-oxidoreductase
MNPITTTIHRQSEIKPRVTRRRFLQSLGAGLMIAVGARPILAQEAPQPRRSGRNRGGFGGAPVKIAARVHIAQDGSITVMTGKVECGQGARAEITLAAAEELRVSPDQIRLIMGDTTLCPDDGGTYGSMTTPRTIPTVRTGCAAARQALAAIACQKLNAKPDDLQFKDGKIACAGQQLSYGDLVSDSLDKAFSQFSAIHTSAPIAATWSMEPMYIPPTSSDRECSTAKFFARRPMERR